MMPSKGNELVLAKATEILESTAVRGGQLQDSSSPAPIGNCTPSIATSWQVVPEARPGHTCKLCPKTFATRKSLRQHERVVHEAKRDVQCTICDKAFKSSRYRDIHIRTVHGGPDGYGVNPRKRKGTSTPRPAFVQKEAMQFKSLQELKKHISKLVGRRLPDVFNALSTSELECSTCQIRFNEKFYYTEHLQLEHSSIEDTGADKVFHCTRDACDRRFRDIRNLIRHVMFHEENCKFICHLCDIQFCHQSSLKRHVAGVHEARREHTCPVCQKHFFTPGKVREHIEIVHEKSRAQTCRLCGKVVSSLYTLKNHIVSVHGTKSSGKKQESVEESKATLLQCRFCDEIVSSKLSLSKHWRQVHSNERQFSCSACGKSFHTEELMERHVKHEHERTRDHQCEQCGLRFVLSWELRRHISMRHSMKTLQCQSCQKTFSCMKYLKLHLKRAHGLLKAQHLCTVCAEAFKTKSLLTAHFIQNHNHDSREPLHNVECQLCGRHCQDLTVLRKHIDTVHNKKKAFIKP